jgi:hypothetical protein
MNDLREKVRTWAYDDSPAPSQDHDLMLISLGINDLLLELAADDTCPKQQDFLDCLYLLVGDAVMTKGAGTSFAEVETLLELAEKEVNPHIATWAKRSRHLLKHPQEFDYDLWCSGGLAAKD